MKLSKNNKLYAAVLGLGVLALGVDKLFLGGGPSEATAQTPGALTDKPNTPGAAGAASMAPTLSVATQLESLGEQMALPPAAADADAFGVPTALAEAVDAEIGRLKAEEQRRAQEKQAAELLASLRLTAVRIPREGTPQALINGQLLKLGNDVPGTAFRVVEITAEKAVLEGAEEGPRITLKLRPDTAQ